MPLQTSIKNTVLSKWMPFVFLLTGTIAFAQDKTSEVDKVFNWATHTTPGCVCAVSQNGKMIVNRAYGSADLERNVPIDTNTIFDAGSLRKQFVAAAALLLVEEGRLSLSDDVRKYIPELPDYGHKITIDQLLTHTSGIRDWTGILPLASKSSDAMTIILRQHGLNFVPGEEWFYSNSGYVLVKEMVVRISKMPFAEFTRQRIFDVLGMKSTAYYEDLREVIRNRALAYDKDGSKWKSAMLLDNERGGAGALLSTASDLLIWNEALTKGRLGKLVTEKLHEQTQLNNGRKLDHSRGLFFDTYRGVKEIWYSGSADGYKSWLGRYPEYGLSIAIMCNSGDGTDRRAFAHRMFDLFVTDTSASKTEFNPLPPAYDVAGLDLGSKTGLYFNEHNGDPLRLVEFRGRLRVDGGPGLAAVTKDRFRRWGAMPQFMSQDAFELQFISNELVELRSMEGNITKYRRARPYAPTTTGLTAFAGRYESDEIGSVFLVTAKPEGLSISLEHAPTKGFDLKPVDTDVFQFSRITIRFQRDKNGKVLALDFSNPAIRNVKFKRLGEKAGAR